MGTKNDFLTDLAFSLDSGTENFINNTYKRIFPHIINITIVTDIALQRQGVDKKLILNNAKCVLIDEKIRRKWYGDILLEEYSDYDRKVKGWLSRDKVTDYISYIVLPTEILYLLPFLLLQKVWIKNYHSWVVNYKRCFAENKNYRTSNIPVPIEILLNEIKIAMIESFGNEKKDS